MDRGRKRPHGSRPAKFHYFDSQDSPWFGNRPARLVLSSCSYTFPSCFLGSYVGFPQNFIRHLPNPMADEKSSGSPSDDEKVLDQKVEHKGVVETSDGELLPDPDVGLSEAEARAAVSCAPLSFTVTR